MNNFNTQFNLKKPIQKIVKIITICYTIAICMMCFLPQSIYPTVKSIETPGIQHFGRITAILIPFNTLVHFGRIPSFSDVCLIVMQNVANIFLLSPLVFGICLIKANFSRFKKVFLTSFLMSLSIEVTQVLLDLLFDFNRVFEVDDLITNTLGGVLAYLFYKKIQRRMIKHGIFTIESKSS
jgi:glycopeptide antibiotics resistance protein